MTRTNVAEFADDGAAWSALVFRVDSRGARGNTLMGLTRRLLWRSTPVLLLLTAVGCGAGTSEDLASVAGRVTCGMKPLAGAVVEFQPLERGGSPSSGTTDENGDYELMYSFDAPGAMVGDHVVRIRTARTDFDDQGNEIQLEERVPAEFNARSTLRRTVEPGDNRFDFDLPLPVD